MFKQKKCLAFLLAAVFFAASLALPAPVSAAPGSVAPGIPVAVYGFEMSQNVINAGQNITIRIKTTIAANSVIAVYQGNVNGVETTINRDATLEVDDGTVKSWAVVVNPSVTQTIMLYVGATAEINTLTSKVSLPITVNSAAAVPTTPAAQTPPPAPTPEPVNTEAAIVDISETSAGKTVTLTVRTGPAANDTWVRFDGGYIKGALGNSDASGKTWTIRFNPSSIQTVTVSSNVAYRTNGADNRDYTIEFTSSIAPPATATITSIYASRASMYVNEATDVTVYTNADANYVWIEYNGGQTVRATQMSGTGSANRSWTARITPNASQTIRALANVTDTTEGAASRSYALTVREEERYGTRATISSADAEWDEDEDDLRNGDSAYLEVTATTNSYANYVWFRYNGRDYTMSRVSRNSNNWEFRRNVTYRSSEDDLIVYASEGSSSNYDHSRRVDIDNQGSNNGDDDEIWSWEFTGSNDDEPLTDDAFKIRVYTGEDVEAIRVVCTEGSGYGSEEDEDTSSTTSGSGHRFDVTLDPPNKDGDNIEYTIYAYLSDDDLEDEDDCDTMTISIDFDF